MSSATLFMGTPEVLESGATPFCSAIIFFAANAHEYCAISFLVGPTSSLYRGSRQQQSTAAGGGFTLIGLPVQRE